MICFAITVLSFWHYAGEENPRPEISSQVSIRTAYTCLLIGITILSFALPKPTLPATEDVMQFVLKMFSKFIDMDAPEWKSANSTSTNSTMATSSTVATTTVTATLTPDPVTYTMTVTAAAAATIAGVCSRCLQLQSLLADGLHLSNTQSFTTEVKNPAWGEGQNQEFNQMSLSGPDRAQLVFVEEAKTSSEVDGDT